MAVGEAFTRELGEVLAAKRPFLAKHLEDIAALTWAGVELTPLCVAYGAPMLRAIETAQRVVPESLMGLTSATVYLGPALLMAASFGWGARLFEEFGVRRES